MYSRHHGPSVSVTHPMLRSSVRTVQHEIRRVAPNRWYWKLMLPEEMLQVLATEGTQVRWGTAARRLWTRVHRDDRETLLLCLRDHLRTGRGFHSLCRIQTDDCHRLFALQCSPRLPGHGAEPTLHGFADWLDAEMKAECQRSEAEQRFHDLCEDVTELVLITDLGGRVMEMNRVARRSLQVPWPEERGQPISEFMAGDSARLGNHLEALLGGAEALPDEYRLRRKDGEAFPVELLARVRFEHGRPAGFQLRAADLSDRKEQESALQLLSGRLLQAQDEEQRRLSRELHDATAQQLVALSWNLQMLRESEIGTQDLHIVEDSAALAQQCLREVRTLSYLLHPPLLDEMGLSSALQWFCHGFGERSGISVAIHIQPGLYRQSMATELAAFRIVQEALNNVHRHSGATRAVVHLKRCANFLQVTIGDCGRGLGTGGIPPSGVGLASMRERAKLAGGSIRIRWSKAGTVVSARMPWNPSEEKDRTE